VSTRIDEIGVKMEKLGLKQGFRVICERFETRRAQNKETRG
jgi:hypothetical protein